MVGDIRSNNMMCHQKIRWPHLFMNIYFVSLDTTHLANIQSTSSKHCVITALSSFSYAAPSINRCFLSFGKEEKVRRPVTHVLSILAKKQWSVRWRIILVQYHNDMISKLSHGNLTIPQTIFDVGAATARFVIGVFSTYLGSIICKQFSYL